MKKIMFNDKFELTQAVLEGRKTQTRRTIKTQPPYENFDIAFPVFEEKCWNDNPLYGAFCWVNKDNPEEHTEWIKPSFKDGEVVAVAQRYSDCGGLNAAGVPRWDVISKIVGSTNAGWNNKMFVRADLMPHQIRITNVRIQRLQGISDEDCLKEGLEWDGVAHQYYVSYKKETGRKTFLGKTPQEAFAHLIDNVSGKGTWDSNPYVWVYDFELIK